MTLKSHVLCQLGHDHVVVAPGPQDEERDTTPEGVRAGGGRSRVIRVSGPALPYDPTYHLLWRIDKIRALILRERPDVLEIDSPYVASASALSVPRRAFGIRTFVWHADFIDTYLRVLLERRTSSRVADVALEPLWAMVRTIARGCDATLVAARWQVEKLRAHGVPRVTHVPFGVEKSVFAPAARSEEARRELSAGAPDGAALLVGVGRFAWEKRWDVVLDAFLQVTSSVPARLVLFGDGPERAAMVARVAGRTDVVFAGFERDREKLARALASADVLMHGCPFETFGLGVAEALCAGLPVVVPDEGGAAELADGGGGIRYKTGDANGCARAVLDLLSNDPAKARVHAIHAAASILDVREQFANACDTYRALLAGRS